MADSEPTFLATEGIHNFRDYGGYPPRGGGRVINGLLYRSGQHFEASESDLGTVSDLGIRTVIDLRGNAERERHPCRRPDLWDGEVVFFDGETSSRPPHEPEKPQPCNGSSGRNGGGRNGRPKPRPSPRRAADSGGGRSSILLPFAEGTRV